MSVFNRCIDNEIFILILYSLLNVQTSIIIIQLKWEYSSPYGLLYALNPPDDVMQFENNGA